MEKAHRAKGVGLFFFEVHQPDETLLTFYDPLPDKLRIVDRWNMLRRRISTGC